MTGWIASRPRNTTADLRRQNLASVIKLVHLRGPMPRAEITENTGLNKSTVLSLVDELAHHGLVTEQQGASNGNRGRPSPVVAPNPHRVVAIATEISVAHARIATVGLGGRVFESVEADVHPAIDGPEATTRALGEASISLLAKGAAVVGAGTAIHGLVTIDGQLVDCPNMGWSSLELASYGQAVLPRELPLLFGNDADLGALAEHRRGIGRNVDAPDLLYLSAEIGIGGGLIRGGERESGRHGHATEVGHLVVNPAGTACACGSRGCLETEVGALALLRKAGRTSSNRRGVEGVLEDAQFGHKQARAAVADAAGWLGFGIGNIVNILDPGLVVCGGFLAGIHQLAADEIEYAARAVIVAGNRRPLHIVPAVLGGDAALVGAAELVFDHVLSDPAALVPVPSSRVPA